MKTNRPVTECSTAFWPEPHALPALDAVMIWNDHPRLNLEPALVRQLIDEVMQSKQMDMHRLEIILTDTEHVHRLNLSWKNADYNTDVLTFSLGSETVIDAEIYVNLDFAEQYCQDYGATFTEEASRYVIHGLLHVLGFDDHTPKERESMRKKENEVLRRVGVTCI